MNYEGQYKEIYWEEVRWMIYIIKDIIANEVCDNSLSK